MGEGGCHSLVYLDLLLILTAGELEVAGVPVQRVLDELHPLADHCDVAPGREENCKGN